MSSEALRLADELDEEAERRVCHVAMAPASLLKDSATELRNLLAANLHMKDLTDQALDDVRQLEAERDQLRAEVERLRKDGEQWQAHKEVLKASCLDESLTIRMTMRHKGLTVEREGVLTMLATDRAIAGGDEVSAHMAGRYYNEMKSAIEAAKEAP